MEKGYIIIQLVFSISFLIVALKRFALEFKKNAKRVDESDLKRLFTEDSTMLALVAISLLEVLIFSLITFGDVNHISGYKILINSIGVWSIFELLKFSKRGLLSISFQIVLVSIINLASLLY